jgi:hypothetical protein
MPVTKNFPRRAVFCAEALSWLDARPSFEGCSFVTSLPDLSETPKLSAAAWKDWFILAASRIVASCPPDGVSIFYQTDVKKNGSWIDKSQLCQTGAGSAGGRLLWHKIVCRQPAGTVTYGRPAYSHMLCFSRGLTISFEHASPDVLPSAGASLWTRGMGLEACRLACQSVLRDTPTRTVIDPFCGRGTVLAVANALGLDAVGVELNRRRAAQSRTLTIEKINTARNR